MERMKRRNQKNLFVTIFLLVSFALWTIAVSCFDVKVIGPEGSSVGFATLNGMFHDLTGVHMPVYTLTDWLGVVPLCFVAGFGLLGCVQLFRRKSLFKVDYSILVLGGFYIIVMAVYAMFEIFVINYRPVLIEGCLEASYPSSTTMLVMCVMPTAVMQLNERIRNKELKKVISCIIIIFTVLMVAGRLISGVHWFTDIAGGAILSACLVMLYYTIRIWPVNTSSGKVS